MNIKTLNQKMDNQNMDPHKCENPYFYATLFYFFHELFIETIRLNTSFSALESL